MECSTLISRRGTDFEPTSSHYLIPSDAHHRFNAEEPDWGYTRYAPLRNLHSIAEGQTRPTIEGDSVDVTVYVRVFKDPTGVLWHNFVK
jgi:ubiquitin carboxyl-terminal hydrolase 7